MNHFTPKMAAIFCLFSVTLCRFAGDTPDNSLSLDNRNDDFNQDLVMPLATQFVTVPRVYISPCPEYFRYTFNGKQWFGLLVINNPARPGIPSRLRVELSLGFQLNSVSLTIRCCHLFIIETLSLHVIFFL